MTLLGSYRTVAYRDVEEKFRTEFQMELYRTENVSVRNGEVPYRISGGTLPYGNVSVRNDVLLVSTVLKIGTEIGTVSNVP